jgi:hypothetical protein
MGLVYVEVQVKSAYSCLLLLPFCNEYMDTNVHFIFFGMHFL